jgi:hypothetical protein
MHPIGHHISWLKYQILEKTRSSTCFTITIFMFYALFVPMLITQPPQWEHMMLVAAIIVVSRGMSISRRCFYVVTKLIFIHPTTNLYAMSVPKIFVHIFTSDSMHLIDHHVSWYWWRQSRLCQVECSYRGEVFYAVTKLFLIHQTTNLYATSVPKTFLLILTIDSMHLIGHHVPWFKFQIYDFNFF